MSGSGIRSLTALYVAAPFSVGYVDFYTFLMPLYAWSLGFDAAEVGILVGARSIVAMFLSIHIGVLMDRFGTRKITLFFVWTLLAHPDRLETDILGTAAEILDHARCRQRGFHVD